MTNDPKDPRSPPSATAEGEEQDLTERSGAERGDPARGDPERGAKREDERSYGELEREGWFQPESSAQKGAPRDEEEG
jgi:hypothetical protein